MSNIETKIQFTLRPCEKHYILESKLEQRNSLRFAQVVDQLLQNCKYYLIVSTILVNMQLVIIGK
jgi:hypothetical protein